MRKSKKKTANLIIRNLIVGAIFISMSCACSSFTKYDGHIGVNYVAKLGNPPADKIIWSPVDFDRVLVSGATFGGKPVQVYILDKATTEKLVIAESDYGRMRGTSWSPDGEFITFVVADYTPGFEQQGSWIVNTEDNSMKYFLEKPGYYVWSPDGKTIALLAGESATGTSPYQIIVSLIDIKTKTGEVVYTNEDALNAFGISWSPDGQHLVISFEMRNSKENHLFILDIKNRQINKLTLTNGGYFPSWSPKGDIIAYQKHYRVDEKLIRSIHLIRPDGSCDVEIPNIKDALSPTWLPDGMLLAFIGPDGIYTLNPNEVFERDIYSELCP